MVPFRGAYKPGGEQRPNDYTLAVHELTLGKVVGIEREKACTTGTIVRTPDMAIDPVMVPTIEIVRSDKRRDFVTLEHAQIGRVLFHEINQSV